MSGDSQGRNLQSYSLPKTWREADVFVPSFAINLQADTLEFDSRPSGFSLVTRSSIEDRRQNFVIELLQGELTMGALAARTMLTSCALQPGLRVMGVWKQIQSVRPEVPGYILVPTPISQICGDIALATR